MNRTVKVIGKAKSNCPPDKITVSLTVEADGMDYQTTLDLAADKLNMVQTAVEKTGFEKQELKTSSFNVTKEYDYAQMGMNGNKREFIGYRCSHGLKLEFDMDMERLGKVLSALSEWADSEFHISFGVKDTDLLKNQLLTQAVKDAAEKAEILTKAAGVKLKEIISVKCGDIDDNIISPTYYKQNAEALRAVSVDITPENIYTEAEVCVEWEIE